MLLRVALFLSNWKLTPCWLRCRCMEVVCRILFCGRRIFPQWSMLVLSVSRNRRCNNFVRDVDIRPVYTGRFFFCPESVWTCVQTEKYTLEPVRKALNGKLYYSCIKQLFIRVYALEIRIKPLASKKWSNLLPNKTEKAVFWHFNYSWNNGFTNSWTYFGQD